MADSGLKWNEKEKKGEWDTLDKDELRNSVGDISKGFAIIRDILIENLSSMDIFNKNHYIHLNELDKNHYIHLNELDKKIYKKRKDESVELKTIDDDNTIEAFLYLLDTLKLALGPMKIGKSMSDFLDTKYLLEKNAKPGSIKMKYKIHSLKVLNAIKLLNKNANILEPILKELGNIDITLYSYSNISTDVLLNTNISNLIESLIRLQGNALLALIPESSDFMNSLINDIRKKVDQVNLLLGDKSSITELADRASSKKLKVLEEEINKLPVDSKKQKILAEIKKHPVGSEEQKILIRYLEEEKALKQVEIAIQKKKDEITNYTQKKDIKGEQTAKYNLKNTPLQEQTIKERDFTMKKIKEIFEENPILGNIQFGGKKNINYHSKYMKYKAKYMLKKSE
jgi:hypothetical protein